MPALGLGLSLGVSPSLGAFPYLTPTLSQIAAARGATFGSSTSGTRKNFIGPGARGVLQDFYRQELSHWVPGPYALPEHTQSGPGVYTTTNLANAFADLVAYGKTASLHALMVPHRDQASVKTAVAGYNLAQAQAEIDGRFNAIKAALGSFVPLRIDVVNEVMRPNGATAADAQGYKLNHWYTAFGSPTGYIDYCFHKAAELWPDSKLYWCDNSTEQQTDSFRRTHATNILNALTSAIDRGVPVHGFSGQAHLETDQTTNYSYFLSFVSEVTTLGLEYCISELDCQHPDPASPTADAEIAACVAGFLAVAMPFCIATSKEIITWGLYDLDSSWPGQIPLPYDSQYRPRGQRAVIAASLATAAPATIGTPPELIVNGGFDTDLSGWTTSFGAATLVGGKAHLQAAGGTGCRIFQVLSGLTIGRDYKLKFDRIAAPTNATTGRVYVSTSNSTGTAIASDASLATELGKELSFEAPATTLYLLLDVSTTTAGRYVEFDNVSLKRATAPPP